MLETTRYLAYSIYVSLSRPHYIVFPHDEAGFSIDDQWFIGGSGLLVKPVTQKDATEAFLYLAEDQVWQFRLLCIISGST